MTKKPSPIRSYSHYPITLPGSHRDTQSPQLTKVFTALIKTLAMAPPPPSPIITLANAQTSSTGPLSPTPSLTSPITSPLSPRNAAQTYPWLPPLGLFSVLTPAVPPDHTFTGTERDATAEMFNDSSLHQLMLHLSLEDLPAQANLRLDHKLFVAVYVIPPDDFDIAAIIKPIREKQLKAHMDEIEVLEREIAEFRAKEEVSEKEKEKDLPSMYSAGKIGSASSGNTPIPQDPPYLTERQSRLSLLKQIVSIANNNPIPTGKTANSQPIPIFLGRSDVIRNNLCPRFQPGFSLPYLPSWHLRIRADVYCQRGNANTGYTLIATATASLCQVLAAQSRLIRVPAIVSDTFASEGDHAGPRCPLRTAYGVRELSGLSFLGTERIAALQALADATRNSQTAGNSIIPGAASTATPASSAANASAKGALISTPLLSALGNANNSGTGSVMGGLTSGTTNDALTAAAVVASARTSLLAPTTGRVARQSLIIPGKLNLSGISENSQKSPTPRKTPRSTRNNPWRTSAEMWSENDPVNTVVTSWDAQTATGDYRYHAPVARNSELPTQLCTIVFEIRSPPFPPLPNTHPDCVAAYNSTNTVPHSHIPQNTPPLASAAMKTAAASTGVSTAGSKTRHARPTSTMAPLASTSSANHGAGLSARDKYVQMLQRPGGSRARTAEPVIPANVSPNVPSQAAPLTLQTSGPTVAKSESTPATESDRVSGNSTGIPETTPVVEPPKFELPVRIPPDYSQPAETAPSPVHTHTHPHTHTVPSELQELIETARKSLPLRKKSMPDIFSNSVAPSSSPILRPATNRSSPPLDATGTTAKLSTSSGTAEHGLSQLIAPHSPLLAPLSVPQSGSGGSGISGASGGERMANIEEQPEYSDEERVVNYDNFDDNDDQARELTAQEEALFASPLGSFLWQLFQAKLSDPTTAASSSAARIMAHTKAGGSSVTQGTHTDETVSDLLLRTRGARFIKSVANSCVEGQLLFSGKGLGPNAVKLLADWLLCESVELAARKAAEEASKREGHRRGSSMLSLYSDGGNSVLDATPTSAADNTLSSGVLPCSVINLAHNPIQDEGLRAFAEAIRTHTGVTALSVVGTGSVAYAGTGNSDAGSGLCALLDAMGGDKAIISRFIGTETGSTMATSLLDNTLNNNPNGLNLTLPRIASNHGSSNNNNGNNNNGSTGNNGSTTTPVLYVDPKLLPVRTGAVNRVNYLLAQKRQSFQNTGGIANYYAATLADRSLLTWSLSYNTSITTLDISGGVPSHVPLLVRVPGSATGGGLGISQLGQGGLKALGRMLMVNDCVRELGIRNTGIGLIPGGLELLAVGLAVNRGLRVLDIADNRLGPAHVQLLCDSLLRRAGQLNNANRNAIGGPSPLILDPRFATSQRSVHATPGNGVGNNDSGITPGGTSGFNSANSSRPWTQGSDRANNIYNGGRNMYNNDGSNNSSRVGSGNTTTDRYGNPYPSAEAGDDAHHDDVAALTAAAEARSLWAEHSLAQLEAEDGKNPQADARPVLEAISLAYNALGNEGVEKVAAWAPKAPQLHTLDLSNVETGGAGVVSLLRMLGDAHCSIRRLSVNQNKLHMAGAAVAEAARSAAEAIVADTMPEGSPRAAAASLGSNEWSLKGADSNAQASKKVDGKDGPGNMSKKIPDSTTSKGASLKTPSGASKGFFKENPKDAKNSEQKGTPTRPVPKKSPPSPKRDKNRGKSAKSGKIDFNSRHSDSVSSELTFDGTNAFMNAAKAVTNTKTSGGNTNNGKNPVPPPLPPLSLALNTHLEYISLSDCGIDDVFVKPFARVISKISSLHTLVLSGNRIRCEGATAIAEWLLRTRDAPHCTLTKLDLSGNSIGDVGGVAIGSAVAVNTRLTTLRLENNHLGIGSASSLLTALTRNQTLVRCDVSSNRIPYELYKRLTALAKRNRGLREAGAVAQLYRKILTLSTENARIPGIIAEARQLRAKAHQLEEDLQNARRNHAETQVKEPRKADGLLRELQEKRQQRVKDIQDLITAYPDDPNMVINAAAPTTTFGKGLGGMSASMGLSMGPSHGYGDVDGLGMGMSSAPLSRRSGEEARPKDNSGAAAAIAARGVFDNLVAEQQASITAKKQLQQAFEDAKSFLLLLQGVQLKQELQTPSLNDLEGLFGDDDATHPTHEAAPASNDSNPTTAAPELPALPLASSASEKPNTAAPGAGMTIRVSPPGTLSRKTSTAPASAKSPVPAGGSPVVNPVVQQKVQRAVSGDDAADGAQSPLRVMSPPPLLVESDDENSPRNDKSEMDV